jgi:membrane protein YdbS with pleckstrin-like domain
MKFFAKFLMHELVPFWMALGALMAAQLFARAACWIVDLRYRMTRWEFEEGDVFVVGRWDGEH